MKKKTLRGLIIATIIGTIILIYYLISAKIDYNKILSYCLEGDVKSALKILKLNDNKILFPNGLIFKYKFDRRFKYATDESNYLERRKSQITELLTMYRNYWRAALLDSSKNYDSILMHNVTNFLINKYPPAHNLIVNEDSLDIYQKRYIESFGLHTTGFGKTGKFYDLLVWKSEKEKNYSFKVGNETTSAAVVFMDDFITLGGRNATLGIAYPGGWATKKALYCLKKSYNLNSEKFKVSYLAHESRHFADYELFPKLKGADLEYRAKLTELSMAQNTLSELIEFFINNANYNSKDADSMADYCVIRDLSKTLFNVEFEKDISKWKKLSKERINKTAEAILVANTKALKLQGIGVETYIKY